MAEQNPFTPTFGQIPPYMAGRNRIIREMAAAFEAKGRAPELSMLISGARGSGKTALLATISDEAAQRGWICANTVAAPGMLQDILLQANAKSEHLTGGNPAKSRLTEIGVGQIVNVSWEHIPEEAGNWRLRMQRLLEELENAGTGLLITVDELDPTLDEAVNLASVYQLFVTESRRVALVMAGLPYNIEKAKQDKRISFVRRAQQRRLRRIDDVEVANAMRKTVEGAGRAISDEALNIAVESAAGFPFMIQLVGYRMWAESPETYEIGAEDAAVGAKLAQAELRESVLESTYRDLSDGDLAFLRAMLEDEGASYTKDIAARLGKSTSYTGIYRERLLRQGIIGEPDRGMVDFEIPGFREFLTERLA